MATTIKKSVLCDLVTRHCDFDFDHLIATTPEDGYDSWNGFCLPMQYTNTADEYAAIRSSCAMFDASPMKKYRFRGEDAGGFLDRILTAPVSQLPAMRAAYGLICDEQGFLVDDGIVIKYADDDYLLQISEQNLDELFARYNDFKALVISEETPSLAGFALQGPQSCAVLHHMGFSGIEQLKPFELTYFDLNGHQCLVGRVGFTGDLGYEVWFSPEALSEIEQAVSSAEQQLNIRIPGYGLSALQICRIEAGMIVPGWDTAGEFSDDTNERTPYELTLGWNVKLERSEHFAGKDALKNHKSSGARFKMKGFTLDSQSSIEFGQALYADIDGVTTQVGTLPSCAWHTAKNHWLGFASIKAAHAERSDLFVVADGNKINCTLCKTVFIDLPQRSQVPAPL